MSAASGRAAASGVARERPGRSGLARFGRQVARNRAGGVGAVILGIVVLLAVTAPLVAPADPYAINRLDRLQGPNWSHPMGTDEFGRDLFSRVVFGARTSLTVGIAAVAVAALLGAPAGLVAGYVGGWVDALVMRVMDVAFAFPAILLALAISAFLEPSLRNATVALGIVFAPGVARVARAPVLAAKHQEYVVASRVAGATPTRILVRHVLPNVASPLIVAATVSFAFALLVEAALSFLGLGAQPPEPSWGVMLSDGRRFTETAPWLAIFPGLAIMLTVLGANLLGDALRDTLDPRLRV